MLNVSGLHYQLDDDTKLTIDHLSLKSGESLLIVGDNASGKSALAGIFSGRIKNYQGVVSLCEKTTSLSFELEAETLEYDRLHDKSEDIEGGIDWGRNAKQIIGEGPELDDIVKLLAIENLLEKPFKILSTGETRKVLMARALMLSPKLIILDEPYAGLDIGSQAHLTQVINHLIDQGTSIVLFDFYHETLPQKITKLVKLQQGQIKFNGNREEIVNSQLWQAEAKPHYTLPKHLPDCTNYDHLESGTPLVEIKDLSVAFQENKVFSQLNWLFNRKEHWRISGPNGCGKSTLLSMISGDSAKAYGKDIWLFGVKRGSGETIWEIKRHYGLVSAQLHRDHRVSATLLHTVLSGFFDSIGLYEQPGIEQVATAKEWLKLLGLEHKEKHYFSELSYGEQRLALIARAMVKLPMVLILDEPCQGLDNNNRAKVLALVDYIAAHSDTHILFVSHDVRDQLNCLTHELKFEKQEEGYKAVSNLSY